MCCVRQGRHGLLDQSGVERWLAYRANRNNTAHDYAKTLPTTH